MSASTIAIAPVQPDDISEDGACGRFNDTAFYVNKEALLRVLRIAEKQLDAQRDGDYDFVGRLIARLT